MQRHHQDKTEFKLLHTRLSSPSVSNLNLKTAITGRVILNYLVDCDRLHY